LKAFLLIPAFWLLTLQTRYNGWASLAGLYFGVFLCGIQFLLGTLQAIAMDCLRFDVMSTGQRWALGLTSGLASAVPPAGIALVFIMPHGGGC